MRPAELPQVGPADRHDQTVETHPAYGMIGASRVTGDCLLAGTDFTHHNSVRVTLYHAEVGRMLSHDWWHTKNLMPISEVYLSEAQWATFVSTLNSGDGTPCTITQLGRELIPAIARTTSRHEQFTQEADEHRTAVIEALNAVGTLIAESREKMPRKIADALTAQVTKALQQIGVNLDFVGQSFAKHVERTIEHAKIEVNAYVTGVIHRTGLAALKDHAPVIELGPSREETPRG